MAAIAIPGQLLSETIPSSVGEGVHIQDKQLISSLASFLPSSNSSKFQSAIPAVPRMTSTLLPEVGTVILGKITRTNARQATIAILAIGAGGEHVCRDAFPGLIRQQDIRATEIDKVKVVESFRTGDIVRAEVISLGDERSYYLSTARNELGVIIAVSEAGNQMYPVSWKELQDPVTGTKETRKVAKPV